MAEIQAPEADGQLGDPVVRAAIYRFACCAMDTRTLELSVGGQAAELEPKPLELLLCLLEMAGEVVTKEEIQERVWPARILSESVLTKTMTKLRQALGDRDQTIIKTVHGYGYRLVAPVSVEWAARTPVPQQLALAAGDAPPQRPHWRLHTALGSGGFGEVWLAAHDKTGEQRVFKFAPDAGALRALKREITLYRLLQHTHGERTDLARVLDWNLEQPPYFLESEYANGGALPQWAASVGGLASVSLDQRLTLIIQAAEALAAAHSAGVLHKDLKPANLLIQQIGATAPQLKLADFGSAHLLDPNQLDQLPVTRMGLTRAAEDTDSSTGTPAYFAPELLAGQPPTIQTDLYALGVILYQIVVADFTRPLAPGWEEQVSDPLLREDIAAAAASDPSKRLRDAAALAHRLRTLPARRTERSRQQAAAEEADRLRVALARARLRRSWAMVTSAVFAVALLVCSALLIEVRSARDQAQHQASVASAVTAFLSEDLFGGADPYNSRDPDIPARALLDRAAALPAARFADAPEAAAAIRYGLASAYHGLADAPAATREARAALALFEKLPQAHEQRQLARLLLADALSDQDLWDSARAELQAVLQAEQQSTTPNAARLLDARGRLAQLDHAGGALEQAGTALDELVIEAERALGAADPVTLRLLRSAGSVDLDLGLEDRAQARYQRIADALAARLGADDPNTIGARIDLARALSRLKRFDASTPLLQAVAAQSTAQLGAEHPQTQRALNELGTDLQNQRRFDEAEAQFRSALATRERLYGDAAMVTRDSLNNLAMLLATQDRDAEAVPLYERALAAERKALGPRHPQTLILAHNLAMALRDTGEAARSIAIQRDNLALASEILPPRHWQTAIYRAVLGQTLGRAGQITEARALLSESLADFIEQFGAEDGRSRRAQAMLDELGPAPPA